MWTILQLLIGLKTNKFVLTLYNSILLERKSTDHIHLNVLNQI